MKSNDENNDDDDTTTSSEQQQQQHHDGNELGDPSGQSTATYWDQWFKTICYNNNNNSNNNTNNNNNNSHCSSNSNDDNDNKNKNNKLSFEWYTTPSEIERLLKNHLFPRLISENNNNNNNNEDKDKDKDKPATTTSSTSALPFRLIHPGSGNSLVPLHLHLHYPYSHHDIIDVSSVALTEIEKYHSFLLSKNNSTTTTTTSNNSPPPPRMMSYHVGDVLTTSLPYDDNIFDGWIDKGLFDALFSSSSSSKETTIENCHLLFNEAHRVLNPGGVCIVVSLGQDHSLELLVNEVWGYQMRGKKKLWELEVEIYELDPVMTEGGAAGGGVAVSSLRPFGFVFRKRHEERLQSMDNKNLIKDDDDDDDDEIMKLSFHHRGENIMTPIIPNDDDDDDDDDENDCHALLAPLRRILSHSRDEFAKTVRKQQQQQSKQASQNNTRFLLATFHVKPQDDTTNLESLRQTITTTSTTAAAAEHNVTSLRWRESRIVPLAFGLQMLVLTVIVSADDVEDVALWMEEEFEEMGVKSVDVDWGETVPVSMDVGDVLRLVTTTTTT